VKNKIDDLRDHLFATLESLRDKEKPMDLDRAETIAKVAQVIVNTATAEVKFLNATGGKGSGFVPSGDDKPQLPAGAKGNVTVHRLK
jgi:hypothetical protein